MNPAQVLLYGKFKSTISNILDSAKSDAFSELEDFIIQYNALDKEPLQVRILDYGQGGFVVKSLEDDIQLCLTNSLEKAQSICQKYNWQIVE